MYMNSFRIGVSFVGLGDVLESTLLKSVLRYTCMNALNLLMFVASVGVSNE